MFMKASAARGKRHSIMTDYVMRMLGLEVCLHCFLACPRHSNSKDMQWEIPLYPPYCFFTAVRLLQRYELAPESLVSHYVMPRHHQSFGEGECMLFHVTHCPAGLCRYDDRQPTGQGHQRWPEEKSDHRSASSQ